MKRLRRIIFNGLTVLSLLLCVTSIALMALSYKRSLQFDVIVGGNGPNGGIMYSPVSGWEISFGDGFIGFLHRRSRTNWEIEFWRPAAAALLFAFLRTGKPASWHLELKRKVAGLCPTCGYDLRATPDRCPECGCVPIKAKA